MTRQVFFKVEDEVGCNYMKDGGALVDSYELLLPSVSKLKKYGKLQNNMKIFVMKPGREIKEL